MPFTCKRNLSTLLGNASTEGFTAMVSGLRLRRLFLLHFADHWRSPGANEVLQADISVNRAGRPPHRDTRANNADVVVFFVKLPRQRGQEEENTPIHTDRREEEKKKKHGSCSPT